MIAVDTSVVVAAFASWHEHHEQASTALLRRPRLPAHVGVETYSVLTRLPSPHRAPADVVQAFLAARFPDPPITLSGHGHRALVRTSVEAGLVGGAVYDALVAATARQAGATLLTRDRRALPAYEAIGVRYEFLD